MAIFGIRNGELDGARVWVHDYNTKEWVKADSAWFVPGVVGTPMSRKLVAFATQAPAEEMAARGSGSVLKWDAVIGLARDGRLEPAVHAEAKPEGRGTLPLPATTGRNR